MSSGNQYDESYFLHGRETGKSLYENYRWLESLTVPMVERIVAHLGITKNDSVLDYGCARGYIVKAFRMLGYCATGTDISRWALENADPEARDHCWLMSEHEPAGFWGADWIIAKDVLEHIEYVNYAVDRLMNNARKGVFAVVPLSEFNGTKYVIRQYEEDVTHVQRLTLTGWLEMFVRPGWRVECAYRLPGVKDNWYGKKEWEKGNGFITCRRIEE